MSESRFIDGDSPVAPNRNEASSQERFASDRLPRGSSIGRYLVIERLGSGGMGVVYAAYDPDLNRKVALKLLHNQPGLLASQGKARLLREAQAMARLSHPNVVAVYDVGLVFDQVFVAMEFVEGLTLHEWLMTQRPLSEILQVFADAGRGLAAAHAAGIVHRDFKPDNVMISRHGRTKVMDFGVARDVGQPLSDPGVFGKGAAPSSPSPPSVPSAISSQEIALDHTLPERSSKGLSALAVSSPLTQEGALMGTPRYMSPEQFRGEPSDARSDQFSFCVALYEAVCGQPPFSGNTLGELAMQVFQGHVRAFPPDKRVPSWLRRVLLRGLQVKPSARHLSLQDLLDELAPERRKKRRRRRILLGVVIGVLVACAVSLGVRHANQTLQAQRCQNVDALLEPVFGRAAQDAAKFGLLSTNKPYAADVFDKVQRNLAQYLADWQAVRQKSCQSTFMQGAQSPDLHARRMRCLDERLQEVAAFMRLLRTADEQVLDGAVDQSDGLSLLEPCSDPHFLAHLVRQKPTEREHIDKLSRELSFARLLYNVGRIALAKEKAQQVLDKAAQIGDFPLQARAERELSSIENSEGNPFGAETRALSAAAFGIRGGDYLTAAWAFTDLLYLAQATQRGASVDKWQQFAEAALAKVEGSTQAKAHIQATLDLYLCRHLSAQRQKAKADEQCEKALRDNERVFGPESSQMDTVLNSLALHNKRRERYPEAEALYRRALALQIAHHGADHPRLVTLHENLGKLLEQVGKNQEAEAELSRALLITERAFGPKHAKLYGTLREIALLKLKRGDVQAALPYARRMVDLAADSPRAPAAKLLLGTVHARLGQPEVALPFHQDALSACVLPACTDHQARLLAVADDLRALHKDKAALPLLEQAARMPFSAAAATTAAAPGPGQEEGTRVKVLRALAETLFAVEGPKSKARIARLATETLKLYAEHLPTQQDEAAAWQAWLQKRNLLPAD